MTRCPPIHSRSQGVALVEFALILPLLLVLTFVTTEFGRALYEYNTVTKSVRDAVRYLSVQTPGTRITEAKNLVVFGNIAGTGSPLARDLTVAKVATPLWTTAGSDPVIEVVTVRVVGYTFVSLFTTAWGLPFGSVTFSDITASMRAAS